MQNATATAIIASITHNDLVGHAFDCGSRFAAAHATATANGAARHEAAAAAVEAHDEYVGWIYANVGLD